MTKTGTGLHKFMHLYCNMQRLPASSKCSAHLMSGRPISPLPEVNWGQALTVPYHPCLPAVSMGSEVLSCVPRENMQAVRNQVQVVLLY